MQGCDIATHVPQELCRKNFATEAPRFRDPQAFTIFPSADQVEL
jgi:hypothetical protein